MTPTGSYGFLWVPISTMGPCGSMAGAISDHDDDDDRGDDVGDGDDDHVVGDDDEDGGGNHGEDDGGSEVGAQRANDSGWQQQSAATGTRRVACPANGMTPFPQAVPHPRGR